MHVKYLSTNVFDYLTDFFKILIYQKLDGGTELAILLLSLTVQGGSGWNLKVPTSVSSLHYPHS